MLLYESGSSLESPYIKCILLVAEALQPKIPYQGCDQRRVGLIWEAFKEVVLLLRQALKERCSRQRLEGIGE